MALQWMILTYMVAIEAAVAIVLTLPTPKILRNRLASLVSLIVQPALFIVPFAGFQLLGALFSLFLKWVYLVSSSNNFNCLKIFTFHFLIDGWLSFVACSCFIFGGLWMITLLGVSWVLKILNLSHFSFWGGLYS